jgi:hypothetical protein
MYAEKDKCEGVSENIMLGQICPLGTGCFDLLLNEQLLQEAFDVAVSEWSTTGRQACMCRQCQAGVLAQAAAVHCWIFVINILSGATFDV